MATILIVDDDRIQRTTLIQQIGECDGYCAETAQSGAEALVRLRDVNKPPVDLVILDLIMPQMDGKQVLQYIRTQHPYLPVIMLTGSDETDAVVALMKLGASDYIIKPAHKERLKLSIAQHLTIRTLHEEVTRLTRKEKGQIFFSDLIGAESGLASPVTVGRKAALSDIPVLITGESGTGKELFARAIHNESARAAFPFVAINCGAIPENLVESTLFGHEKGSFTGAISREVGKFREAAGGTLLLDEVGELKPDIQTKLLRVLQQKEIQPVGAGTPVKINVRILSATNRNLAKEVAEGRFRSDLYYRLNVLPIALPSLGERRGDIALLADHMLSRFAAMEQKSALTISAGGMRWLNQQAWNGNVRELENFLYRAVVLAEKEMLDEAAFTAMARQEVRDILHGKPDHYVTLLDESGRTKTWDEMEAEIIAATLRRSHDNVAEAALLLGMGQSTLYKKLGGKAA